MLETVLLRTAAETATEAVGSSLGRSLHRFPVTIGLSGALGAGKTAFMRGFLRELGVTDHVTSPTYALEQRYATDRAEVIHVDLYRLHEPEATALLAQSDDHRGIRCVEWPERAQGLIQDIAVRIGETDTGTREIAVAFDDVAWPDDATIDAWRENLRLPPNVAAHCDAVADVCVRTAEALLARGTVARPAFVRAAGKVHDLLRFVDFKPGAAPPGHVDAPEDIAAWSAWKAAHPECATHEEAVEMFLREQGFPELGRVAYEHSIKFSPDARESTESHIVYYADKRVIGNAVVTLDERFRDFTIRYRNGLETPENTRWEEEARAAERLLFPDGPPV